MQDITFQINVIAISVAFIAISMLLVMLAIFFFLINFSYRFGDKLDTIINRLNDILERTESITNMVGDEVSKIKGNLEMVHGLFNSVGSGINNISNFARGFSIKGIIAAVVKLFSK